MKSFFEEYGFVMLAAVVLIALITMSSPLAKSVQEGVTTTMDNFTSKINGDFADIGNLTEYENYTAPTTH